MCIYSLLHSRLLLFVSLFRFVNHTNFSIFFTYELLGKIELFNEKPLEFHHDDVVFVLILEINKEGVLRFLVASKEKCNADKECLLQDFIIVYVLDVFTQELNAANIDQGILLSLNDLLVVFPIFTTPVSCWSNQFFVFNFNNFPQKRKTCNVKVFTQTLGVQESHK